jgi:Spy/CpxP family protein refolding chaperone
MKLGRALLITVACTMMLVGWAIAQDSKKKDSTTETKKDQATDSKQDASAKDGKGKGRLPQYYGQLGLSDEQKRQIHKIQSDLGAKIDELQEQINKLKQEEKQAIEKVLTAAQRARLLEILKEKAGAGDGKTGDGKSSENKPSNK